MIDEMRQKEHSRTAICRPNEFSLRSVLQPQCASDNCSKLIWLNSNRCLTSDLDFRPLHSFYLHRYVCNRFGLKFQNEKKTQIIKRKLLSAFDSEIILFITSQPHICTIHIYLCKHIWNECHFNLIYAQLVIWLEKMPTSRIFWSMQSDHRSGVR